MSAIRHIRKNVFGLSQSAFAELISVSQSTVCRWEDGVTFDVKDMEAIREAAHKRGIRWRDEWFFEPSPHQPAKPEAAA